MNIFQSCGWVSRIYVQFRLKLVSDKEIFRGGRGLGTERLGDCLLEYNSSGTVVEELRYIVVERLQTQESEE